MTEENARRYLDKMLQEVCGSRLQTVTVQEYLRDWYERKSVEVAYTTFCTYRKTCERLITTLGDQARLPLFTLTSKQLEAYRAYMVEAKLAPRTINVAIKVARMAISEAHKRGMIFSNPAAFIKPVRLYANTREVFSTEQIKSLLEVANDDWKGMILLGLYCGMRMRDAANLTKENIDLERGTITYMPQKLKGRGKPAIVIPMSSQLAMFIRSRFDIEGLAIFPNLNGQRTAGKTGLSLQFAGLLDKAKINRMERQTVGIKRFYALSFHSLRHTCVSIMANSGVSEEIRRRLVGHTSDVHQNYTHMELDTLRESIAKMPFVA